MGNTRFRQRIRNSKDVLGEGGYVINWPFRSGGGGEEQEEKIERDQGGTVFKGTSKVVEKSADGQNETHENWKVPVKIPFSSFEGESLGEGGWRGVSAY